MKKIVAMAMTLCLMLGLAVAENENTFTGTAKGFGGDVSVTITVEDGRITDAVVTGDNETPSIGGQAVETLGGAIVEAQSAEFDSVSGCNRDQQRCARGTQGCDASGGIDGGGKPDHDCRNL